MATFVADKEATQNDKDMLLLRDHENNMDRTCMQRGSFKENRNKTDNCTWNQKKKHLKFLGHLMKVSYVQQQGFS